MRYRYIWKQNLFGGWGRGIDCIILKLSEPEILRFCYQILLLYFIVFNYFTFCFTCQSRLMAAIFIKRYMLANVILYYYSYYSQMKLRKRIIYGFRALVCYQRCHDCHGRLMINRWDRMRRRIKNGMLSDNDVNSSFWPQIGLRFSDSIIIGLASMRR